MEHTSILKLYSYILLLFTKFFNNKFVTQWYNLVKKYVAEGTVIKNTDKLDYNILFIIFLLFVASCYYIFQAQHLEQYGDGYLLKQILFCIVGFIIMISVAIFDFDSLKKIHWILYGLGILILLGLFIVPDVLAPNIKGAVRWYRLPFIGSFQPSELMKVFLIISMSSILYSHNRKETMSKFKNDSLLLLKLLATMVPPILIFMRQPDMGVIMVTLSIFISIILVSDIDIKLVLTMILTPVLAIFGFVYLFFTKHEVLEKHFLNHLEPYQVKRFYGWLMPTEHSDAGYQTILSMSAIGSGTMYGREDSLFYLPEAHTDFIFAVIGHTHGFVGTSLIVILYFFLIYRVIMIGLHCHDKFGSYLCAGVAGMLAFQVFQNIGMNVGLLPVTGFALPFLSYGGSALLAACLAIGLVLSVKYNTKQYMFQDDDE